MPYREYMVKLHLDEHELAARRSYFELTDADLARLAQLKPFALKYHDEIVEEFYVLILGHDETRAFFPDEPTVRRVKNLQKQYFLQLFNGVVDLAYVQDRLRVGAVHEKIGMPIRYYLGSYAKYMRLIHERLQKEITDARELHLAFSSIQKLVFFDMSIAFDTYVAASVDALSRHQAAIRELSTPVIKLHDRLLMLPLVGTIDTQRAQQVMETVLLRVVEEQAKAIIIDIAGVPVVDTKVADHLLKTTAAVRLLGAETILTGITAQVARTVVQLGLDISVMHTRSRLADGLELALSIVGKSVVEAK